MEECVIFIRHMFVVVANVKTMSSFSAKVKTITPGVHFPVLSMLLLTKSSAMIER